MRKLRGAFFLSMLAFTAGAQDFPGYSSGNYTGVAGAVYNPAYIADSRYRWDVNIASAHVIAANDRLSFSLSNIGQSFNGDTLNNRFFGANAQKANMRATAMVLGPSFMMNLPSKFSFAFTTRARAVINVRNFDGALIKKLTDSISPSSAASLPLTISEPGTMGVEMYGWTEYGFTLAREVYSKNAHFLKAGATFKYMAGLGQAFLNITDLNGSLNADFIRRDGYLANTTGQIGIGMTGLDFAHFDFSQVAQYHGYGVGADFGLIYEYRPDYKRYKNEFGTYSPRDKYRVRIAVAMLDIGSIKFNRDPARSATYDISILANSRYYISQLRGISVNDVKKNFDQYPNQFTSLGAGGFYRVSLPTSLQLNADVAAGGGFYFNAAARIYTASDQLDYYTFTPRFENSTFGVYVPLSYNTLTNFNAGVTLRAGPLFIGSGSLLNAIFSNTKQADAFIGLHVYHLRRKKNTKKAAKTQEQKLSPDSPIAIYEQSQKEAAKRATDSAQVVTAPVPVDMQKKDHKKKRRGLFDFLRKRPVDTTGEVRTHYRNSEPN